MSVILNNTELNFINKTNYLIEIIFSGEQESNLRVVHNSSNVITKIDSNLISALFAYVWGEDTNIVRINLLPKNSVNIKIKCNANLNFQIHPKIKDAISTEYGEFDIDTEFQNTKLEVELTANYGIGYCENGDVAINVNQPVFRDLCVNPRVYMDTQLLDIEYKTSFCKIKV